MNDILDNKSYSVSERLEMAKILLEMKDKEIQQLTARLDKEKITRGWCEEQAGVHRMGL